MRKTLFLFILCGMVISCFADKQADASNWYLTPSIGGIVTHNHLPFKGAYMVGYQAGFFFDESRDGSLEMGLWYSEARSRYNDSTILAQATLDVLHHFAPFEKLNPYLALGVTVLYSNTTIFNTYYKDKDDARIDDQSRIAGGIRFGGGIFYNFSKSFSLRTGLCLTIANHNLCDDAASVFTTANTGVVWRF